jgi:hypothetical protein
MAQLRTVKDIVSSASMEIGIVSAPISTISGSDQDIAQMVALLDAVADEVLLDAPYRTTLGDGVWLHDVEGNPKVTPTADSDRVLFDARLAINGLKFRFLKSKGLEFGEEMRDFTQRLNKLAGAAEGNVIDLYADEGRII